MSCLGQAWCPECKQIISSSCICALVCDIHGRVCTPYPPDGKHDVRREGAKTVMTQQEYLNGWQIGYFAWGPGDDYKGPARWHMRDPGHPTKSPLQLQQEEWAENGRKARLEREAIFETRVDGAGI